MTYIFCHSSWWPFGYTITRQIFEQDLPWNPSPHTWVHLDVTLCTSVSDLSPPFSVEEVGTASEREAGPGCRAGMCLSLSHSSHFTTASQDLAWWVVEAQQRKHMLFSFKNLLLSSKSSFRKPLHFWREWGLWCMGHSFSGFPILGSEAIDRSSCARRQVSLDLTFLFCKNLWKDLDS